MLYTNEQLSDIKCFMELMLRTMYAVFCQLRECLTNFIIPDPRCFQKQLGTVPQYYAAAHFLGPYVSARQQAIHDLLDIFLCFYAACWIAQWKRLNLNYWTG